MRELAVSPALRAELGERARARVEELLSIRKIGEAMRKRLVEIDPGIDRAV